MENLNFYHGHGQNFDHLTTVIDKILVMVVVKIFDHMTMKPGRRSKKCGQCLQIPGYCPGKLTQCTNTIVHRF